jgi:hypothetical protein
MQIKLANHKLELLLKKNVSVHLLYDDEGARDIISNEYMFSLL